MSLNVANCPRCGSIYQKNLRDMCISCSSQIDNDINQCLKYLWKFPKTPTEELGQAMNIEASLIIQFIKQGLFSKSFKNLTYPCDSCASPIRDNRLCSKCLGSFRDLAHQIATPKTLVPISGFKIGDRLRY
jgi:hypothetical protein